MASVDFSTLQNYLKQRLSPRIESQYPKETALLSNLQKNVGIEQIADKFLITVVKSLHSGVAAVGKGETLPTGKAATARVELSPKYLFAGFSADDQDLEMARSSELALANFLTLNETQMREAIAKQLNRMFLQNGDGTITTANGSAASSTTLVVNNSTPNADIPGTKYLSEGMYIKIGTAAAVQITSIDSDTQVTLSAARSWSNADAVKLVGPDGSVGVEPTGLKDAIATDNNTFQTINRATNPWWKPHLFSSATTYSTARQLENKVTEMLMKSGEYGKVDAIFANIAAYRRLVADAQSIQRVVNSVDLKGGFKGLAFAASGRDVPVILDYDCPDGVIYGITFAHLVLAQLSPLKWLELDGSGNVLRLQGKATWEGFLKQYVNLGVRKSRGNFAITNGTFTV